MSVVVTPMLGCVHWRDVVALLRIQSGHLDESYLDAWAERLQIGDLLERARTAASP